MQNKTITLTVVTYKFYKDGFKVFSIKSADNEDYILWVESRFSSDLLVQKKVEIQESESKPGNWKLVRFIEKDSGPKKENMLSNLSSLQHFTGQIFQGLCSHYDNSNKTPDELMLEASKLAIEYSSRLNLIVKSRGN
jgi:hypothetical protein